MANTAFTHDPTITVPSSSTANGVVLWNGTTGKNFDNTNSQYLTFNGVLLDIKNDDSAASEIRLYCDTGNNHWQAIRGGAHGGTSYTMILPHEPPTATQVLTTASISSNVAVLDWADTASSADDTAYASSWNGVTTIPPSKNAVYDKIETITAPDDTAYASSWNGVTTIAPSKNAVYDKIELLAPIAGATFTGTTTFGTLSDGTIAVTAWVDQDDMSSNSATLIPTQQSVKAYVDAGGGDFSAGGDATSGNRILGNNGNHSLAFETNDTTRMTIENYGRVIIPVDIQLGASSPTSGSDTAQQIVMKGKVGAHVRRSTAQTHTTSGNEEKLVFNAVVWDSDNMADLGSSSTDERLTIRTAGLYLIRAGCAFPGGTTGHRNVSIFDGNAGVSLMQARFDSWSGSDNINHVSTVAYLATNNYIYVMVYQNSGGSMALQSYGTYGLSLSAIKIA